MKTFSKYIWMIAALMPVMMLTSCRHKDLYFPEPQATSRLQIVFDWRNAPDADPESMAAYMYDQDGLNPLRFIFDNKNGGEIKAPNGVHHLLFMNADNTSWVCLRGNETVDEMELYTLDAEVLRLRDCRRPRCPEHVIQRLSVWPRLPECCGADGLTTTSSQPMRAWRP